MSYQHMSGVRRPGHRVVPVVVIGGLLLATVGATGVVIAAVVAAVWYFASAVYAFAVGQLLLVLLADPTALGSGTLLGAQVGLAVPLVSTLFDRWPADVATGTTAVFVIAMATLATTVALVGDAIVYAVALLVLGYVLSAYGLYRYELVSVDHVEVEAQP